MQSPGVGGEVCVRGQRNREHGKGKKGIIVQCTFVVKEVTGKGRERSVGEGSGRGECVHRIIKEVKGC